MLLRRSAELAAGLPSLSWFSVSRNYQSLIIKSQLQIQTMPRSWIEERWHSSGIKVFRKRRSSWLSIERRCVVCSSENATGTQRWASGRGYMVVAVLFMTAIPIDQSRNQRPLRSVGHADGGSNGCGFTRRQTWKRPSHSIPCRRQRPRQRWSSTLGTDSPDQDDGSWALVSSWAILVSWLRIMLDLEFTLISSSKFLQSPYTCQRNIIL